MSEHEYKHTYTIDISAPVHAVFEHCRDPRNMFAGHPKIHVDDATVTPEGVGTVAHVWNQTMPVTEYVTHEFVTFVPDQQIVINSHLKLLNRDLKQHVGWTWNFVPEGEGTRLNVHFENTDITWIEEVMMNTVAEKGWAHTVNGWLEHIKTEVEKESAAAQ
ncbi:SRPBCC family protein [Sinomonas sp. P10A9]|uniref:SRPBCC family protein n=1 Tax=Sinomonas puerhi TaxID=3238584 RepID=A0AB39L4E5_9MICC